MLSIYTNGLSALRKENGE